MAMAVLPAESRNSLGRSREHQSNPGKKGRRPAAGGSPAYPTGGGEGRGRLTAWGSRTRRWRGGVAWPWGGVTDHRTSRGCMGWVGWKEASRFARLEGHVPFLPLSRRLHRRPPRPAVVGPAKQFRHWYFWCLDSLQLFPPYFSSISIIFYSIVLKKYLIKRLQPFILTKSLYIYYNSVI